MMKRLVYGLFGLLLNACVDQGSSDVEFVLFNQTDKSVQVLGFNTQLSSGINKADPIIIVPNSTFKVTRVTGIDDNVNMSFYSLKNGVDSVRIIFDREKVKIYTRTPSNSCNICDGDENHQYFITQQDYEDAEPCDKDCE